MEYKIIRAKLFAEFEAMVNTHLAEGWKLAGGIAFSELYCCQAMTKEN